MKADGFGFKGHGTRMAIPVSKYAFTLGEPKLLR